MTEIPESPPETPAPPAPIKYLWFVRGLAIAALAISGYLAWVAITEQTAAGCGSGKVDCEYVLSSRWSKIVNQPVSIAATSLWMTVLVVSLFARSSNIKLRSALQFLLMALTVGAAGAAVWFVGLQAFVIKHWCTYCLIAHACALAAAGVMLAQGSVPQASRTRGILAGLLLAALVPIGQVVVPPEPGYELHRVPSATTKEPLIIVGVASGDANEMEVLGGSAKVKIAGLPRLGPPDAEYVLISMYDYACWHCQILHEHLLAAQREYNGKLAIVMLPMPLSPRCNPNFTAETGTAPQACELAKYALIVWSLEPKKFAEFDAWLFEPIKPRTAADARAKAVDLVGEERFAAAEKDERFEHALQQHIELHQRSPADLVPQVMSRDVILSGGVNSTAELVEALESEFGWRR